MRKFLKSAIVSLWCSTWVKKCVILESDLRYFELHPCYKLRFFFCESHFFQKFRIPEIRFFARITYPKDGLNKKEIQLNLCNLFYILLFNELYLFA